jgi:hypothetical protein
MSVTPIQKSINLIFLAVLSLSPPLRGAERFEEAAPLPNKITFSDITQLSGIHFKHDNAASPRRRIIETMGSGGAWIDFDGDGFLDFFLVNGGRTPEHNPDTPSRHTLYRNRGDGTFEDVTEKAGVCGDGTFGMGAAVADFDGDGYPDLFVTGFPHSILYRNRGDGTFEDVSKQAGLVHEGRLGSSAGWFDYDKDGWPDLLVLNYVMYSFDKEKPCTDPTRPSVTYYCNPSYYPEIAATLYRNNGDGTFTDVTRQSGIANNTGKGLGVILADFNNDGWPDIFISNDGVRNLLFWNQGDGTFKEAAFEGGVAFREDGYAEAGMGVDAADFMRKGWFGIYVTHLELQWNRLYRYDGHNEFTDITREAGLGVDPNLVSGFGAKFMDFDNDGWPDLLVVNGHPVDNIPLLNPRVEYAEPKFMLRNMGDGKFQDASRWLGPAFQTKHVGRGAIVGDFDNDGDLDIVTTNNGQAPELLRNDGGNTNNWIAFRLVGTKSNRDAIGAHVSVKTTAGAQMDEIKGGTSYLATGDPRLYFGLGTVDNVSEVEIRWPSGKLETYKDLKSRQILTIAEGNGILPYKFPVRKSVLPDVVEATETEVQKPTKDINIQLLDVAREAGIDLLNVCGRTDKKEYIAEVNGNGAAFFDYDNDGRLDVLVVNGSTLDNIKKGGDQMVALYHNEGGGKFKDVTPQSGMKKKGWGMGVCVGDYDNDGFQDVFITAFGPGVLFHNNGDGTFTDVTRLAGIGNARWSTNCAFGDYDRDGNVDLYVANYIDFSEEKVGPPGSKPNCQYMGIPVMCGPVGLTGEPDVLFRNNGDGTFSDVTRQAGINDPGYDGFGVVFADFNNDGWPDIYVADDSVPSLLFINNRDGTFTETAALAGVGTNLMGRPQAGTGVGVGDYKNDGNLAIFKTNFSQDTHNLYQNDGTANFQDMIYNAGLVGVSQQYLGWGTGFVDFDNDGWLDIFVANGHVYPDIEKYPQIGSKYLEPKQLFHNLGGGAYHDVTSKVGGGLLIPKSSRGAAFGDYDNDGDIDVLVINMNDQPTLLRNEGGNAAHWITLKLVGTKSNRDAIGARVSVEAGGLTRTAEVQSGGSYLSHSDMRLHFGLGESTKPNRVSVRWPSGLVEHFDNLEADRFLEIREGQGVLPLNAPK